MIKPILHFHKHEKCRGGYNTVCKNCRKPLSKLNYESQTREYKLWYRAKRRALIKKLEFSLDLNDIEVPEKCPVFGVEMLQNSEYAPSLDRIDSSKGYVKGNIQVISTKANTIKNNATQKELELFAKWILR